MMHRMKDHNEERAADEHIFESQQESERDSYNKVNDLENKENETDNSDIVIKDDKAMEVTLLEPIQSVFPITQSTPPPLCWIYQIVIIYMLPIYYQRVGIIY
ncbi:uncharacterized protein LOC105198545 [Solenopsis invicta]|uniref:uncharacterized protein LOC105198545 n=1 Tax=Solenopsis invicta TaxID=13686 RepID=UPI00193CE7AF|nr:uncharacterized protein LOC105198545 [Solenopsis invicta]